MKSVKRRVAEPGSNYLSSSVEKRISNTGIDNLSDAEVLSTLINSRSEKYSKIEIATNALKKIGSLDRLVNLERHEFLKIDGFTESAFNRMHAAIELDRRRLFIQCTKQDFLTSPDVVREFIQRELAGYKDECLGIIYLNNRHAVIETRELFVGTIDSCACYTRTIVASCIELNSNSVLVYHQHPSGVTIPSSADINFSKKVRDAVSLLDIRLLDSLIIGTGSITSLAEQGYL